MEIKTNLEKYLNDYFEVYNLFFPNLENCESHNLSVMISEKEKGFELEVEFDNVTETFEHNYEGGGAVGILTAQPNFCQIVESAVFVNLPGIQVTVIVAQGHFFRIVMV